MKLGRFELNDVYLEDSYKAIKEIPDKSVNLIYTDIPYLYTNGGAGGLLKDVVRRELYTEELSQFDKGIDYSILDEFVRIMKYIYIYIWCSKEQIPDLLNYFIAKGCSFNILVWCKTNPTPFCNNVFLPDIEYCLVFREHGTKMNDGIKLKSKWYISKKNVEDKKDYVHATIKPLELVKRHILLSTQPNDIVFDAFSGSSTTLVAAKELGRQYLGFEINEKYYKISKDRLNGVNQKGEMDLFNTDFEKEQEHYEQMNLFEKEN